MAVISVINVTFTYPGASEPALLDVCLEVERGEVLVLLGINGSGKTTLLQHLNGLLLPDTGQVLLHGMPLWRYRDRELFSRVGLVFQDPNDQLFAATVGEDVAYGPRNLGVPAKEVPGLVREALASVDLGGFEARPVRALSYGQKKRAALAGILVMQPEILLLDEPTAGIDPLGAWRLLDLLRELKEGRGLTVVAATHDVDLAAVFADRVCLLSRGRLVKSGTREEVLADAPALRAAGLRLPRIAHLAEIMCTRDGWAAEALPLTIGQARRWIGRRFGGKNDKARGEKDNAADL